PAADPASCACQPLCLRGALPVSTGSGKTVSLYTGLNILNTPERNISTAEDPVEINLEGVNQVNMNNKVGLNFGAALRAFLRQDPDRKSTRLNSSHVKNSNAVSSL